MQLTSLGHTFYARLTVLYQSGQCAVDIGVMSERLQYACMSLQY